MSETNPPAVIDSTGEHTDAFDAHPTLYRVFLDSIHELSKQLLRVSDPSRTAIAGCVNDHLDRTYNTIFADIPDSVLIKTFGEYVDDEEEIWELAGFTRLDQTWPDVDSVPKWTARGAYNAALRETLTERLPTIRLARVVTVGLERLVSTTHETTDDEQLTPGEAVSDLVSWASALNDWEDAESIASRIHAGHLCGQEPLPIYDVVLSGTPSKELWLVARWLVEVWPDYLTEIPESYADALSASDD